MRIKLWYFRIQQKWAIFLQVYVTHFEYWLPSKFPNLTAHPNKSHPGGKYFIYEREEIISFSWLSEKTTGKLFPHEQPQRKLFNVLMKKGLRWKIFSKLIKEWARLFGLLFLFSFSMFIVIRKKPRYQILEIDFERKNPFKSAQSFRKYL